MVREKKPDKRNSVKESEKIKGTNFFYPIPQSLLGAFHYPNFS
jgi:hypothetical protein